MSLKPLQFRHWTKARTLRAILLVLAGISVGALATRFIPDRNNSSEIAEELGIRARSGPWGELYFVPFTIAAPDALLPIRAVESEGTRWVFKDTTRTEVSNLLESAGVPAEQRDALLAPGVARVRNMDIELTPTPETVIALPARARPAIYRKLAQFPENRSAFNYIHKDTLADRFDDSGVSKDTLALFRTFCCEHGDYLVLGGLPALLAQIPDYGEKVRFMKALTRQKTMLLRLRVTKDSDLRMLSEYWGRGVWASSRRSFLESIEHVPGGTFTSILALLPALPSSQLYFYPVAQATPLNGPALVRDCHWSSLNFFRDTPDPQFSDPANFAKEITANYFPIAGDPRFGDILILAKPDGDIVHSAVFIADEIVFTKNGATAIHPWMLSTVPDLLKQYSFLAPDGQHLSLRYFRNKGV